MIDTEILIECDQILQHEQAQMLLDYANGLDSHAIASRLGVSAMELKTIELDTRAALGAKTTVHMVSRAWQLGILSTKCLCVVLACLSAQINDDAIRINRHGRSRAPTSIARVKTGNSGRELNA